MTIVLGVTGGIAAYKACELVSLLRRQGHEVWCVMTESATKLVTPLTFETLTGHPVAVDAFSRKTPHDIEHIALARRADVVCVAPATANCLAKYAHGIADNLLATTLLATRAPVLLAPAMNTAMWEHPATVANVELLKQRGVAFVGPETGHLACGEEGAGRMTDVDAIAKAVSEQSSIAQAMRHGSRTE